jgi:Tol biopolymer transport system component
MADHDHPTRLLPLIAAVALTTLLLLMIAAAKPAGAAFPGENGKMAFVRGVDSNSEIYVMDGDGSGQTSLTNNLAFDTLPAFSPDGRHVAFTSRRDSIGTQTNDEIYVVDAADSDGNGNGDKLTRLTSSQTVNEFQPAFSPDGKKMAFTSNGDGNNEIYVMNADGSGTPTRLTNNVAIDSRSVFSPDGGKLAFSRRDPASPDLSMRTDDIYVMNADGTGQTRLTFAARADTHANFSPDGEKIAFSSARDGGNNEIYVMKANGTEQTRLTSNDATDEFPAFSSDGEKLAFSSNRDGNFEIYVMNSNGSGTPTRLTNTLESESKPDWGPLSDTTPPDITLTTPADSATYTLGQLVNAEYSCQDETGGSGLVSCAGPVRNSDPIDTAPVGPRTFTVEAADDAGNTASRSHVYSVLYAFGGFFSPVDDPPTFNAVKAGRAIPVKFSLGGDQGLDIFAEGYPRSATIPADPNAPLDAIEQTETAGESSLSYDPTTDRYTYVWKTDKAWAGQSRQLVLKLDDGSEHEASFELN